MQLEKVTARSNDASLAGWIASNDATLFTMVLAVVIAIFLHSKLSSGARDTQELRQSHAALAEDLATTTGALESARVELFGASDKLSSTQQQLTEKLDRIEQLMMRLHAANAEKSQLEKQRDTLTAATNTLAEEKSELSAAKTSLQERLDDISRQLAEKLSAMDAMESQRDRLQSQADQLEIVVADLSRERDTAARDLAGERDRAAAAQATAAESISQLEIRAAAAEQHVDEYVAQLKRSAALLQTVSNEKLQLQTALDQAAQQRQQELVVESRNNRELVGLAGRLERVAILFDASGSMRQAAAVGDRDRWTEAQEIAARWLNHLNVRRCVLIVFAGDVRTFPDDGSLADLSGDHGGEARATLLKQLQAVSPGGLTNTLAALQKAYEYDIDTMLLFSDGAPSMADTGYFDPAIARQIYDLCDQHAKIPVNTIGLGNYFDKDMSTFLRTMAIKTGGTFRGQ